jgi:uncharacterized protein YodC (DUF2158 family)
MKTKMFKPGDRVTRRNDNNVMYVSKYKLKKNPFLGTYLSDNEVECVWYENGKRHVRSFDQRTLSKAVGENPQPSQFDPKGFYYSG